MSATFFADCGGPFDLSPAHTISSHECQETSGAEIAIMEFLKSEPWHYLHKRLLHVGVGNSSLPLTFAHDLSNYIGITISLPEIAHFEQVFSGTPQAQAILLNKYDPRMYEELAGKFDVIVDTLLKSFACCEKHFVAMMEFFVTKLTKGGILLTTKTGVLWGWKGNTQIAHTPGAQTDPEIGRFRVLGFDELSRLCERLGLTMNSVDAPSHLQMDDRVIILSKQ